MYNFGPDFEKWFEALFHDSYSTVINNGHISEFCKLQGGCRHGYPLSPYILLLVIEPLAMKLKAEPKIKRLTFGSREYKLGQYADDMFMMLYGS